MSAEELKLADFKAYLASDSDESDSDNEEDGDTSHQIEITAPPSASEAKGKEKKTKIDPTKIASVEQGDLAKSVVATGQIEPITKVEVKIATIMLNIPRLWKYDTISSCA